VLICRWENANHFIGKIIDIRLSKLVDLGTVLKTGTAQYIVQDVVTSAGLQVSTCTLIVDFWSLAVIIYLLLSTTPPISEDRKCSPYLRVQILSTNYQFYLKLFDTISSPARLLKVGSEERISAEKILKQAGQCLDGHPADGEEEAEGGGSGAGA
jgi:hypothetical protein